MAYEFYVSIEGSKQGKFKGESKRKAHKDKIVGLQFDYSVDVPHEAGSGMATGKRKHSPVKLVKRWDAATIQIFQACVTGETLKSVLFEFVRAGPKGTESLFYTVKLTNARIVSIRQMAGIPREGVDSDSHELEEVSFTFQKIELQYTSGGLIAIDDWASPA